MSAGARAWEGRAEAMVTAGSGLPGRGVARRRGAAGRRAEKGLRP